MLKKEKDLQKNNRFIHKTQHRKPRIMQHEPYQTLGLISGFPDGYVDPPLYLAPVVLLIY